MRVREGRAIILMCLINYIMKINYILIRAVNLLAMCFMFYLCQTKHAESDVQIINIPVKSIETSVVLSEIADNVDYIPLETNDTTILDRITRIIDKEGYLYVSDSHSVYKFDYQGKLYAKIGKEGRGPNDYKSISDFQLASDESVWILSKGNKCLYNYGWNGGLNRRIELKYWASKICLLDDSTLLLYTGNEKSADNSYQLLLLDIETNSAISHFLPIDDKKSKYVHVLFDNCFNRENDSIYFYNVFCDTVYSLVQNRLMPQYYFNLANKNIPNSFYDAKYRDVRDFFQHLLKNEYAYGINFFMKSANYSLMSYYYGGECYMSLISNRDGSSKIGNRICADLSLFNYPILLNDQPIFSSSNREIVIPLIPDDIMEYAENTLNKDEQSILRERISYSGSDQNVVLLKIKVK